MPLQAVLYQADLLNHGRKDHPNLHSFFGGSYDEGYDPFHFLTSQTQNCSYDNTSYWPSMPEKENKSVLPSPGYIQKIGSQKDCPRSRRRMGGVMDEEVMHHQRLTHIVVERNRRKQVNEYLSTLRLLMPHSYASKGDQASIIGGAINFVKELEQKLQWLESHKHTNNYTSSNNSFPSSLPFSDFITSSHDSATNDLHSIFKKRMNMIVNNAADVEVSIAECFANLKIRAITGPVKNQLLLRILEHLDECKLTVLHLNVCSAEQVVLYTICMKVEDECNLTSGDEIAAAVRQLLSTRAAMG